LKHLLAMIHHISAVADY